VHEHGNLHAVVDVELGQDRGHVRLDGGETDVVARGDLRVGPPRADLDGRGALPFGEYATPWGR
jgi:hypothetical protein